MRNAATTFWTEPRPPTPPGNTGFDVAGVVALTALVVVEGALRDDVTGRALSISVALVVVLSLWWRRTHPFAAFLVAFGVTLLADGAAWVRGVEWEPLYSGVSLLFFPYALFRFGAGRHALLGLGVMFVAYLSAFVGGEIQTASDAIGGLGVLLLPVAIGVTGRIRDRAHRRDITEIKHRERARLARDLHDTVAHHVSAIAIQAQAGRAVAPTDPAAVMGILATIEEQASQTLTELRGMVSALRDDDDDGAPVGPQQTIADLETLVSAKNGPLSVVLSRKGNLKHLRPSVEAAVYRIAQEAITNTLRHGRDAKTLSVVVEGTDTDVHLTVVDDGARTPSGRARAGGFGLVGMAERAALLGGRCVAGPAPDRGWKVAAVLPRGDKAG